MLEATISLGIFLVVVAGALATYAPSRRIYTQGERKADVQQNARLAMAEMARQVRMAGWFPENFATPPAATPLTDAIRVATDDSLAIHGDLEGSGNSRLFMFCLEGTELRRTKAKVDKPAAYKCHRGKLLAENVTELKFTYFDADGNPVPSPPSGSFRLDDQDVGAVPNMDTTTQRRAVRRVFVELTTERATSRGPESVTLTSDIALRNGN